MFDAILFRMRNEDHELVCSVRNDVVRLHVDGQRVKLPRVLRLTLDDVMTDWPAWLGRSGWRLVEEA